MLTMYSFVVDSADHEAIVVAKEELHMLLQKPSVAGIPVLVVGNKSDLPSHMTSDELIHQLDLEPLGRHRELSCYGISAKEETNLDAVLQWLIKHRSS